MRRTDRPAWKLTQAVATGLLCYAGAQSVLSQEVRPQEWQADSYFYFSSGDYGDSGDTKILYVPVIMKRIFSRGEISAIVPYLSVEAPEGTIIVDGQSEGGGESGTTVSENGLGDIVLKGKYSFLEQEGRRPWIDGAVRLKLPTADENKGLGTGAADLGIGLEMVKTYPRQWIGFMDLYYTFIGNGSDAEYDNRLSISPGAGRQVTKELLLAAFYEYNTAIGSGEDPQLLSLLFQRKLGTDASFYAMLDLGLSDGAADYGILVGGCLRF